LRPEDSILSLTSLQAAPLLLGWRIVRSTPAGIIKLKIVETEAYHQDDPASHSYRGMTARTAPMFEAGGTIYVYFTYGMHYCLNFVTGPKGVGEGVLIRAGEPMDGTEIMKKNRGVESINMLANGPAKLTQALGINSTELSGKILNKSSISLEAPADILTAKDIVTSRRVGIRQAVENPWRFYIKDNPFVSKSKI
jgi:DNA-3-methyladenine glycosylase